MADIRIDIDGNNLRFLVVDLYSEGGTGSVWLTTPYWDSDNIVYIDKHDFTRLAREFRELADWLEQQG